MNDTVKVIDLFAGPGGLGEGFSAFRDKAGAPRFRIALSIEKEKSAHKTLALRAFYRQFPDGEAPPEYYEFLSGQRGRYPDDDLFTVHHLRKPVENARSEALNLTLGKDNRTINRHIEAALGKRTKHWILIGGPPCQAYSLVGRSRNMGIRDYIAEEDHRNYLYREYLKVISRFQPSVFVMENVKGMLSARVGGVRMFPKILADLTSPKRALSSLDPLVEYEIFSLVTPHGPDLLDGGDLAPSDYVIRAEDFGVPQARHRVILLGIRKDMASSWSSDMVLRERSSRVSTGDVIGDLPKLRSGLSVREQSSVDSSRNWITAVCGDSQRILTQVASHGLHDVADCMSAAFEQIGKSNLGRGSNWNLGKKRQYANRLDPDLRQWFEDSAHSNIVANHETRSHIPGDLHRYLFCACYAGSASPGEATSPKTHDFPKALMADHANWDSGHFSDRFRTQIAGRSATTITSHISKDGHYYIHYDPVQCRSLTVREAARIQTFPDNYFFVGNRTQQYVQVGNAVPPYLARQIAQIVYRIVSGSA